MTCKCNGCKMILTLVGWWCPHKAWAYTDGRQLSWQEKNRVPKFLRKLIRVAPETSCKLSLIDGGNEFVTACGNSYTNGDGIPEGPRYCQFCRKHITGIHPLYAGRVLQGNGD